MPWLVLMIVDPNLIWFSIIIPGVLPLVTVAVLDELLHQWLHGN